MNVINKPVSVEDQRLLSQLKEMEKKNKEAANTNEMYERKIGEISDTLELICVKFALFS